MSDKPIPASAARTAILRSASQAFRRHGYGGTGVTEVFAEAGVPRGSLYYHFPSGKAEIGAAAIHRSGRAVSRAFDQALSRPDLAGALDAIATVLADNLERSEFLDGCPMATVALEKAGNDDHIGTACRTVLTSWIDQLSIGLRQRGLDPVEAADQALLILAAFEGALLIARIQRDTSALRRTAGLLIRQLPDRKRSQAD